MNTYGSAFKVTTFGESHGEGIGCVCDGVPAGLKIDEDFIQAQLNRRKPGQNSYSTPRAESDTVQILSGTYEGFSTGAPIALFIANQNQKSKDYDSLKELFRPGHADFSYFYKYGIKDHRGGGRSSARESAARVAAGAIAKLFLNEFNIEVLSGLSGVGELKAHELDFSYAQKSEIYALDKTSESSWKELIQKVRSEHDSIGGEVLLKAKNLPVGLGEPLYDKLDGRIGKEFLALNAVKAVEIGEGVKASCLKGSANNDQMDKNGFLSNHSGGVLGGISTGQDLDVKVHFKPTPSIFQDQKTLNLNKQETICSLRGRHDPCVAIRGSVVCEMMLSAMLMDFMLLNMRSSMENIKKIYM